MNYLKLKIYLFNIFYYICRVISLILLRKEGVYCFPIKIFYAPSEQQRKAALRDLLPLRGRRLKRKLLSLDKKDATVLDVGANIGYSSFLYRKVFKKSSIYAFEPFPKNFSYLKKNNTGKEINFINLGLSNEKSTLEFGIPSDHYESKNTGRVTSLKNIWSGLEESIKVDVIPGDTFIKRNNINNVVFIKIDVEGMELEVLNGLENTILKDRPAICIELNGTYLSFDNKILGYLKNLEGLGYRFFRFTNKLIEYELKDISIRSNHDVFLFQDM